MGLVKKEQLLHEQQLEELTKLAILISSRTDYRASVIIDSKNQAFKVIVYVNNEEKSRIATYRNYIYYKELSEKFNECNERLNYFLNERTKENGLDESK